VASMLLANVSAFSCGRQGEAKPSDKLVCCKALPTPHYKTQRFGPTELPSLLPSRTDNVPAKVISAASPFSARSTYRY
jgi:hypothetical protein